MYLSGRVGSGRLPREQEAVLVGMALQNKPAEALEKELMMPSHQVGLG
jgi:tRNA(Met) C34 N-acetyltransferase TmcA